MGNENDDAAIAKELKELGEVDDGDGDEFDALEK